LTHSQEIAHDLIEDYRIKYEDKYDLNAEQHRKILCLCRLVDTLSDEFSASAIDIQVAPNDVCGAIHLYTDELIFEHGRSHQFFDDIKEADFLSFSKSKSGELQLRFGVNDLWVMK